MAVKQKLIEAFLDLLEGNLHHAGAHSRRLEELEEHQQPEVLTVCCSDSRVLQDEIWENRIP